MCQKLIQLTTAASLVVGSTPAFASLGLQATNPLRIPEPRVICLQSDFGYLHEEVARLLAGIPRHDGIAPNYASEALKLQTEELPNLLRQLAFPEEAEIVEQEIALMYGVGCVARI